MSEPGWNDESAFSFDSRSGTGSEAGPGENLTPGKSPAAQDTEGTSFPPVNYAGWVEAQAASRKEPDTDDSGGGDEDNDAEGGDREEAIGENRHSREGEEETDDKPTASGGFRLSWLVSTFRMVTWNTEPAVKKVIALARCYPRASMASGLSAAILVAVLILQPGKGKHDTTAQIGKVPAQTIPPSETQKVRTDSTSHPFSSAPAVNESDPHSKKSGGLADVELPVLSGNPDPAAGKNETRSAGTDQGVQSKGKTEPAPALDATEVTPVLPLTGEPVKLTTAEGLVMPAPAGEAQSPATKTLAAQEEKMAPGHVGDLAPAPEPAPNLAPVMELAAAEVKPGTPPDSAHAPAPSLKSALPPVMQSPLAPATSAPLSTPAARPLGKTVLDNTKKHPKDISETQGHAALGITAAATMVGGAVFGASAAVGTVTALGKSRHAPAITNDKQVANIQQAPANLSEPAPAPVLSSTSPPLKTVEPKPLTGDPAPVHAAGSNPSSQPLTVATPLPVVVEPPSRTVESPSRTEASSVGLPGELPALHPAGDPVPAATQVVGSRGGGSVDRERDLKPHDKADLSSSAGQAAKAQPEDFARLGWEPIRHSGGEAVRDVQRDVPGLEDDPPATTPNGTADSQAHADREQSFDAESPATGHIKEMVSGTDATRTGSPGERSQGKLDTVLHRVEGRENFWDISRMYYDSGRYYRALWKANSDKVPDIAKLYQGTIIRIPPPEDLDPVYIDPPGKRPGSNRTDGEILAGHEIQADDQRFQPIRSHHDKPADRQRSCEW